MGLLIKRFEGQYNASIVQARGTASIMSLSTDGVTFFGDVKNLTGIDVYELTFN